MQQLYQGGHGRRQKLLKRGQCVVLIVCLAISITALAITDGLDSNPENTTARQEELEYKRSVIEQGQNRNTLQNDDAPMTEEEDRVLKEKAEEAARRAVIRRDYCERTVALVNQTLGTNYQVKTEFDYELMRAVVDAYHTQGLSEEEKGLLEGYMGEYCCGLDGSDPLYDEIMQIFDYPFGEGTP